MSVQFPRLPSLPDLKGPKADKGVILYTEKAPPPLLDRYECRLCALFQAPDNCNVVDGTISPNGWCLFWAPSRPLVPWFVESGSK